MPGYALTHSSLFHSRSLTPCDCEFSLPYFSFLQQAFNIGPIGPGGTGGAGSGLFNQFFNMVGNPNDYVFSQAGLDNIVSQLMEQAAA